jgi:hypothetical protein
MSQSSTGGRRNRIFVAIAKVAWTAMIAILVSVGWAYHHDLQHAGQLVAVAMVTTPLLYFLGLVMIRAAKPEEVETAALEGELLPPQAPRPCPRPLPSPKPGNQVGIKPNPVRQLSR